MLFIISLKLPSKVLMSKSERFSPCEIIKGTKSKIKLIINRRDRSKVVITANVFLNFNLFFKN